MTDNIFQIGRGKSPSALDALMQRRSAKVREVETAFMTPKVLDYDYIWFIQCGGAAMFQRTLSAIYKTYPEIRKRMHASILDFATEADDKRSDFDIMPLGQAVNGRLRDIRRRTDLPWERLTEAEIAVIEQFVADFPNQTYDDGAGACPPLGKLGMLAALDDTIEYIKVIFQEFKNQGAKRILPIIVLGAGGGTGMGIYQLVERIVEQTGKQFGILGPAGMVRIVFAHQAYGYQLYDEVGQMTKNAELIRERCDRAWADQRNSIFAMSEMGSDGLLALVHAILEGKLIMNNNVANRGYPNAVVTGHDTPPWKMQRIASDLIERGTEPSQPIKMWKLSGFGRTKTLSLNALPLNTVGDYAVAHRLLQKNRAQVELARTLREANTIPANVSNYAAFENLAAAELTRIKSMADKLRRNSRANGAYTLPNEADLAKLIMGAPIGEILEGVFSIPRGERELAHMVPNGVLFRKSYPLGDAIVLFEQGQLDDGEEIGRLVPITYTVISREDRERAEAAEYRSTIKDALFNE